MNMLNKLDKDKYAFPLLGCYVKLRRFDLALNLACLNNDYLKHLLFLVDVDKLYKASLAEYNLEMAMKIISKHFFIIYITFYNNLRHLYNETVDLFNY